MNSQPNKHRPPRSAPRPATGPTASSAARSLRRAAQTAYSASSHSDSPPPLAPPVSVIAQIPNFAKSRATAPNSAHQAPPSDSIPDDPYLVLSKAARGVDSLAKSRNATLQSLATTTTPQPAVAPTLAASPVPQEQSSSASSSSSGTPAAPVVPATPVTRDAQERWVDRLPEWQRFAIQAVVMIAAAIMVVVGFAWWRQSNEPINEPISRQALKELEIEEGTPDDISVDDGQESTEPRGSLARKSPRASDWSDRESSGSRNASDTTNVASPSYTRDSVSAPPTIEDSAPGSPAATSPNSPPRTTPPHALEGATPTINAPEQAGYPSTDPRRFQFGVAPSGAGGNSPPGTAPRQPTAADGSTQPPSETARLGEITPLRSGNLR